MNKFLTLAATSLAALQMQVVAQEVLMEAGWLKYYQHLISIELQMKGFAWIIVALPILSVLRAGLVL